MSRLLSLTALAAAVALHGCGPSIGSATVLDLSSIPSEVTAGEELEITVTVQNEKGETVTAYKSEISASVTGPLGTENLEGEKSVTAKDGVAVFKLALTTAGAEQQLQFRPAAQGESRLVLKKSKAIAVKPAAADHLELQASPKKGAPGGILYPYAVIRVVDRFGNLVTSALQVSAALGANPTGASLGGSLTRSTVNGEIDFTDLTVDKAGQGYTLVFTASGVSPGTSAAFEVGTPKLVYTDPTSGPIRLVKNAASTDSVVVLDLKVFESVANAYSAGLNLPVDLRCVKAPTSAAVFTRGDSALDPGAAPAAVVGALHTQGAGSGILTAGISQKASGTGASLTHRTLEVGKVLFTIRLEADPKAMFKPVFDGANLGNGFAAAVRDRAGEDQSRGYTWGIGKLEVQ